MPAIMTIDQVGLPAGQPGFSRTDGLDTGALVTVESVGGGTTSLVNLLWVPPADTTAVASLTQTGPTTWQFLPDAGTYGSYRIELVTDEGLPTESRQIRIFGVRTPVLGLLIPAANEIADNEATLLNNTLATIDRSEQNEPFGPFATGSSWGWWLALSELILAVEGGGGGGQTLDDVMTTGTPDNDVVIPPTDPLRLYSAMGTMLELLAAVDQAVVNGESVIVRGGRNGTGSAEVVIATFGQGGATASGPISVSTGTTDAGVSGALILAGGGTQTGTGGDVTIDGGFGNDPAATPGNVVIRGGENFASPTRGSVTLLGGYVSATGAPTSGGGVSGNEGINIAGNAAIMVANGDPNGNIGAQRGSILMEYTTPALYQNTDGGTAWRELGPNVLWQWNGVDATQFLSPVDLDVGADIAGFSLTAVAGGPNGTLLRVGSTDLDAGGVLFPIDFAFPRRYVIEVTFYRIDFTDVTNAGRNYIGTCIAASPSGAQALALGNQNPAAAPPAGQALAEVPFNVGGGGFGSAPLAFNAIASASFSPDPTFALQSGLALRFEVNTQRPFVAATPQITVTIDGSGPDAGSPQTYPRVCGSTSGTPAYPAEWDGITLSRLGLVALNGGTTTGWTADIESIRVLRHPADR